MKFYIQEDVATTCFAGNMNCVMAIAQENFKANFYYLYIWRNSTLPAARAALTMRVTAGFCMATGLSWLRWGSGWRR